MAELLVWWAVVGGIGFIFSLGGSLISLSDAKRDIRILNDPRNSWDRRHNLRSVKRSRTFLRNWTLAMGGSLIWPVLVAGGVLALCVAVVWYVPQGAWYIVKWIPEGIIDWYQLAFKAEKAVEE